MSLNATPRANRIHIGIFGKTNSGKSSLINAITGQQISIVSPTSGTTTDPVYKSMEVNGIGPCVFIDTAGIDDTTELGKSRIMQTNKVIQKCDIAIVVISDDNLDAEVNLISELKKLNIPTIPVINKIDIIPDYTHLSNKINILTNSIPVPISACNNSGIDILIDSIKKQVAKNNELISITGHLVKKNDIVLLVMPQDIQAPQGRLILPQVQTIRELLDNKCIAICSTLDNVEQILSLLKQPPKLIITDSQVFKKVYELKPTQSKIASFSILFARIKGDINVFLEGAKAIDTLTKDSKILIAEACTHAPMHEDIGREKIPKMIRNRVGNDVKIDIVSGDDFPTDLREYNLIIHCGSCMFNRKHVLTRIQQAKAQNVPITNYGIAIAKMLGILEKVAI